MKLKALDQIHVSSVKPDSLRPKEEFEVSDELGNELLKKHPGGFERLETKAEPAPLNKAEPAAPANKAITGRKAKSKAE